MYKFFSVKNVKIVAFEYLKVVSKIIRLFEKQILAD